MIGLLMILKQAEKLSDEAIVLEWQLNPYHQIFCGMREIQCRQSCHSSELVHFRKRIGEEGGYGVFLMSIALSSELR